MSDAIDLATVAFAAFFAVLAVVLLARYRNASQSISQSSERTNDLWEALQERLKKQDERIIDLMSRVEILQARALTQSSPLQPVRYVMPRDITQTQPQQRVGPVRLVREMKTASRLGDGLGDTEMTVIELLGAGSKSTIDIKEAIGLSREHTARTMKDLFDQGLVTRDDSEKPFVYQLTDRGRSYLEASGV